MSLDENELRKALESRSGQVTPEYRARVRQAMAENAPAPTNWMAVVAALVVTALTATSVGVLVAARHARVSGPVARAPRVTSPTPAPVPGPAKVELSAPSVPVVWALVDYGALYRSTDSGDHWEKRSLPSDFAIRPSIAFVDAEEGWLLAPGSPATQCDTATAVVWHTSDGASTWQKLQATGIADAQCKDGIWFVDSMHGFIGASDPNRRPTVYRTSDGGNHWSSSTVPDNPIFVTSGAGFTLHVNWMKAFGQAIYLEASGSQDDPNWHDRDFIYTSRDGGRTWVWKQKVASPYTYLVSESRWLQLAPDVMESVNGGQAFGPYQCDLRVYPPLQAYFVDADLGYVVASVGTVWRSVDGGVRWTQVATPWSPPPVISPTPTTSPASPARTNPACLSSPPPAATWQTYRDTKYGFTISYPRGYYFERVGADRLGPGELAWYRAVDDCYLGNYPGGQVEISIFADDASPLTTFVTKHSRAQCTDSAAAGGYYWAPLNLKSTTQAGRPAATFDMDTTYCVESSGAMDHVTVFVLKSGQVFSFMWWSSDAGYLPTMQSIAEHMLASFKD